MFARYLKSWAWAVRKMRYKVHWYSTMVNICSSVHESTVRTFTTVLAMLQNAMIMPPDTSTPTCVPSRVVQWWSLVIQPRDNWRNILGICMELTFPPPMIFPRSLKYRGKRRTVVRHSNVTFVRRYTVVLLILNPTFELIVATSHIVAQSAAWSLQGHMTGSDMRMCTTGQGSFVKGPSKMAALGVANRRFLDQINCGSTCKAKLAYYASGRSAVKNSENGIYITITMFPIRRIWIS